MPAKIKKDKDYFLKELKNLIIKTELSDRNTKYNEMIKKMIESIEKLWTLKMIRRRQKINKRDHIAIGNFAIQKIINQYENDN